MWLARALGLVGLGVACNGDKDADTSPVDADGDGFTASEDCDDADAAVKPDAEEICDSVDNDCDGTVDGEGVTDAATWYADGDGGGYGNGEAAPIRQRGKPCLFKQWSGRWWVLEPLPPLAAAAASPQQRAPRKAWAGQIRWGWRIHRSSRLGALPAPRWAHGR